MNLIERASRRRYSAEEKSAVVARYVANHAGFTYRSVAETLIFETLGNRRPLPGPKGIQAMVLSIATPGLLLALVFLQIPVL